MNAPLSSELEGRVVTWPMHGARFDVTTGKHLRNGHLEGVVGAMAKRSKTGRLMDAIRTHELPIYEVQVDGDKVYVVLLWPGLLG